MYNKTKVLFFSLIIFTLCACGNESDNASDCNTVITTGVLPFQNELDLFEAAGNNFNTNQTRENCEAYVQSARDLTAAMRLYSECLSGQERVNFDQQLSTTEDIPDSIDCDF